MSESSTSNTEVPYRDMFPSGPEYYAQYFIDEFRSLRSFRIRLEEGLNVLVGPNGSGKTNFIDFLDFLSTFLEGGASMAVSRLGGLSRVFSQETLRNRIPRIRAQVHGLADLKPYSDPDDDRTLFRFQYDLDVRFNKQHSTIYVAGESLKFKSLFWSDLAVSVDRTVGTIALKRRGPGEDVEPTWEVGKRLLTRGRSNPLRYQDRFGNRARNIRPSTLLEDPPRLAPDQSFLSGRAGVVVRTGTPALDAVRASLARGRAFNLNPAQARLPDDLSRPPIIGPDGSGVSATLFHMQQARTAKAQASMYIRRFSKESLDQIVSWTTLVLPELEDIDTRADPQTGKYISNLLVDAGDQKLRIPLQSASDGTLKWLSFVSLISSRGSIYSLEEPENYLHPRMQSALIDLIRESLSGEHPGYFLLTSHSESIINQCRPRELLLFEFRGGCTTVNRLSNPTTVEEQINKTGFGLGYYYASNAVS